MFILLDPNVGYLLLMAGVVLATLAVAAPGTGILEVLALAVLGTAAYIAAKIGINWWALVILLVAIVPLVISIRKTKLGWLLILSLVGIVFGSAYLFPTFGLLPSVNLVLVIVASILVVGFIWFASRKVIQAAKVKPLHNPDKVIGMNGYTKTAVHDSGTVQVGPELYSARSDKEIPAGKWVVVTGRQGFTLLIEEDKKPRR
jgi:membrane-bound serine protease (ClpP class)